MTDNEELLQAVGARLESELQDRRAGAITGAAGTEIELNTPATVNFESPVPGAGSKSTAR